VANRERSKDLLFTPQMQKELIKADYKIGLLLRDLLFWEIVCMLAKRRRQVLCLSTSSYLLKNSCAVIILQQTGYGKHLNQNPFMMENVRSRQISIVGKLKSVES